MYRVEGRCEEGGKAGELIAIGSCSLEVLNVSVCREGSEDTLRQLLAAS